MQKLFIKQAGDTLQNGGAFKRWLYRGQRPGWIAKIFNRMWAIKASRKALSNGLVALEVIGRKSGRVISFPLVIVRVDEQRYLASMLGDNMQWVRNVRAAGGKAVLRSGGYENVLLEEIPIDQRAPILKAYLQVASGARPHIPVDKDAPLAEFEKIAAEFPVFRLASLQKSPADDLSLYASHPNPVTDYMEAVQWVENKIAAEVDFDPGSHTILLTHGARTPKAVVFVHGYPSSPSPFKKIAGQFYDRGYNVLVMTMPYHGLADRMNTEHARLRAEDFIRYAEDVLDIARGLGDHITMVGISCGGLVTAWAAQQRQDLDRAVLISPGFGFKAIPRFWTPLMAWALRVLPNLYIWDDPEQKADNPRRYNYLRNSTHVLGQILRLSRAVQALARGVAPAAVSIVVITNLNDPGVDNVVTDRVVELWRTRWAKEVQTYQFPADLGLGHDIIDVKDANMNVAVVYPKLLELIDQ